MTDVLIDRLRTLRKRAHRLNAELADDLRPFLHTIDGRTFRRLPEPSERDDVTVASTCTALMAMVMASKQKQLYSPTVAANKAVLEALQFVIDADWQSSKLPYENAFTRTLVLRTAGMIASAGIATAEDLLAHTHAERPSKPSQAYYSPMVPADVRVRRSRKRTLKEIALEIASGGADAFRVLQYPPAMTLLYWFVDAVARLDIPVARTKWALIGAWVGREFSRQMSLMASRHSSMMDPVALIMAACTARKLRKRRAAHDADDEALDTNLPSDVELRQAVRLLFAEQSPTGIWPKYFALFHYPNGGFNFTFSFEFLEAIVTEFGETSLFLEADVIATLERTVNWCEANRLEFRFQDRIYRGWNSGGQTDTLGEGKPESWATGTVHMYLSMLVDALSMALDGEIKTRYSATIVRAPDDKPWNDFVDTSIRIGRSKSTVKTVIGTYLLDGAQQLQRYSPDRPMELRRKSALLFGPPGTSKTRLVKAFATAIGWPFIEIDPSHFLRDGLNAVYERTNAIFRDLGDLRRAVVLFDEVDALVRRRPGGDEPPVDIGREFLTTTMLPRLARLHEKGKVIYFVATNHRDVMDEAITRAGRFDLHVFIGIPTWDEKLKRLEHFLPSGTASESVNATRKILRERLRDRQRTREQLRWFTYQETKTLFEEFKGSAEYPAVLNQRREGKTADRRFDELVSDFAEHRIAMRAAGTEDSEQRRQYESERGRSLIL